MSDAISEAINSGFDLYERSRAQWKAREAALLAELRALAEQSAYHRADARVMRERNAVLEASIQALITEQGRLNALLEEAAEELPDGLTRSERAARDADDEEREAQS